MRFGHLSLVFSSLLALPIVAHADPAIISFSGTLGTGQFTIGAPPVYTQNGTFSGSYGDTTAMATVTDSLGTFTLTNFSETDTDIFFSDNSGNTLDLAFVQGLSASPFCTVSDSEDTCPNGASLFGVPAPPFGFVSDESVLSATAEATIVPPAATPEPSSLVLLGTGILGLAGAARRKFARI